VKGYNNKPLIVCITGLPGAGKTTVADALKGMGFSVISMGDVVRNEAKRRGLELNDANLGKVMLELRSTYGPDAIAVYVGEMIKSMNDSYGSREEGEGREEKEEGRRCYYAIDGLRSVKEADRLKEYGYVKILAVHAPRARRFEFLVKRGRSDAPTDMHEFNARDRRELDVGVAEAIAFADAIVNNDCSKDELVKRALTIVKRWIDEYEDMKAKD
jgi:dephospho-CoA kinase